MTSALASSRTAVEALALGTAGALVGMLATFAYRAWKRSQITPEERERRRRAALVLRGKMGDATLVDVSDTMLLYSYDVRGVEYTASQDVSQLRTYIPADLSAIGPVAVRYDPKNPANSIVLAEQWTGLRTIKTE